VQLVISDFRMPSMNGVEFLKKVYAQWPDTVRMVLSGYADASAIVSAINEGHIYKFAPKPWNDDDLKVTVSNAIERYFLFKKNLELTTELRAKNNELAGLNIELKKLLDEKSANLEFRSKVLSIHQNMLDSMPVGIIGVDFSSMVVMCNEKWIDIAGMMGCPLGQSIESCVIGDVMDFIEEVKTKQAASKRMEINGVDGWLLGSLMDYVDAQKGIILVFVRAEDVNG
ncbi:MAG: response regulator, partial [Deltaproteobacteria bacterium]|nr:response regulator [Deltaproteobacteria bacterium]